MKIFHIISTLFLATLTILYPNNVHCNTKNCDFLGKEVVKAIKT